MRSVEEGLNKFRLYFRDGKTLGHAIVTLNSGTPVHLEPGQAVPDNVDPRAHWEPFDSAQEAEEVLQAVLLERVARKYLGQWRFDERWELIPDDWDQLSKIPELKPWMKRLLEFFRTRNQEGVTPLDIEREAVQWNIKFQSKYVTLLNAVISKYGFKLLQIAAPGESGGWSRKPLRFYYVGLRQGKEEEQGEIESAITSTE